MSLPDYFVKNERNLKYLGNFLIGTGATASGIVTLVNGVSKLNSGDNSGITEIAVSIIPFAFGIKHSAYFLTETYQRIRR